MTVLVLILLIVAAASFLAAAVGVGGRFNLVAVGLFAWVLVPLCQLINRMG